MRRNELDRAISEIEGDIREFEQKGSEYWSLPGDHPNVPRYEVSIKVLSRRIGIRLTTLTKRFRNFRFKSDDYLIRLRQIITGKQFDVAGRQANPERIPDIKFAADDLIDAIRVAHKYF